MDPNRLLDFFNRTRINGDMPLPRVGLPEGLCIRHCPKATPSFVPHKSQLTPPTQVILSILESSHGELPLAHHFNPVIPSFHG
jgi:hypothetical protein